MICRNVGCKMGRGILLVFVVIFIFVVHKNVDNIHGEE